MSGFNPGALHEYCESSELKELFPCATTNWNRNVSSCDADSRIPQHNTLMKTFNLVIPSKDSIQFTNQPNNDLWRNNCPEDKYSIHMTGKEVALYSVLIAAGGAVVYKVSEVGIKCLYNKLSNKNNNIKQNDSEAGNDENQSFIQNTTTSNFICLDNFHSKRSPSNIFSIGSLMNKLTGGVINFN